MPEQIVVSEKTATMSEVKAELEKIKKRDTDLNFRSAKTYDYLNQFVSLTDNEAKELFDKIMKLDVPRLRDVHINKIIDLMPSTINELKIILHSYTTTVSNENMKKIIDAMAEFRK
ncbi:MAG TPA: hypothetical protein VI894_00870 [Candidatus Nanoarchaeia archaeon]|nr:hypothetical protein [Candidatus Nanoarchaeia archaeon]